MDKLVREFLDNSKVFFPIYGSKEKEYIKNLEYHLIDFCEENEISSIEEMYRKYGNPSEVAYSYFSNINLDYIIKKLKMTRIIKSFLLFLTIISFVAVSVYSIRLYNDYQTFKEQQIYFEETTIE